MWLLKGVAGVLIIFGLLFVALWYERRHQIEEEDRWRKKAPALRG